MRKVCRLASNWKDRQFDNGFIEDKSGHLVKEGKRYKVGQKYVRFQIMSEEEVWITKAMFRPLQPSVRD